MPHKLSTAALIIRRTAVLLTFAAAVPGMTCAAATSEEPQESSARDDWSPLDSVRQSVIRIVSRGDRASGMLVTDAGLAVTVAHGLHADAGAVEVWLYDGTRLRARIVAVDRQVDLALIQLEEPPIVLPGRRNGLANAPLQRDQWVLAAGYPGREGSGQSPVFRIGRVLASGRDAVRTTCTLTAGDSGGPLFDLQGRLAGLHRQIGAAADNNVHVSVSVIREFLERQGVRLPQSEEQTPLPPLVRMAAPPNEQRRARSAAITVRIRLPARRVDSPARDELSEQGGQPEPVALGTRLSELLVATKLSLLAAVTEVDCEFADGEQIAATVVRTDAALDLALLRLDQAVPVVLPVAGVDFGGVVRDTQAMSVGLIARTHHREGPLPFRLGATLAEQQPDGLVVSSVQPNSFAAVCGLRVEDQLRGFAGEAVSDFTSLESALNRRQPGDWVSVEVRRNGTQQTLYGQLLHDPRSEFEKAEFLDGRAGRLSRRRTGFAGVLQHDLTTAPEACGGPLFNADSELVGINIARRARESTLAIPIATVLQFARLAP